MKPLLGLLLSAACFGQIQQKIFVSPPITGSGTVSSPMGCPSCTSTGGGTGYSPNGLISGGGVVWTGSLNFSVSAAAYVILGTQYSSPLSAVTLSNGGAQDRIDVIAVDVTSSVVVIQGTESATPAQPVVDPATQLGLTFVYVAASATTPSNIATTLVYDEDVGSPTEYNATNSGAGFTLNSTNNPYHGTKDIEATGVTTGNYVQLQKGSGTIDPSAFNVMVFYLRSKAAWNKNRALSIYLANAGTQVGVAIAFAEGSFGFVSSATSAYQQFVVPFALFQAGSQPVNQIVFKVAGSGGALGFYLDYVQLQSGAVQLAAPNSMNWRGPWISTTAYSLYDVVTYNSSSWVALAPTTNSAPSTTNTNWSALGGSLTHATYRAAICIAGSSTPGVNTPTSQNPTSACVTGSNVLTATLNFSDADLNTGYEHLRLPSTWSGTLAASIAWRTANTSGSVQWNVAAACSAANATIDPAWNATAQATAAASGSANAAVFTTVSVIDVSGCAAGNELWWKLFRNKPSSGGVDTLVGTADLISIDFTY